MPVRSGVTPARDQKAALLSWYANGAPVRGAVAMH